MVIAVTALLLMLAGDDRAAGCVRLARPVAQGAFVAATDLSDHLSCPAEVSEAAFGFDAGASALRARRDLAAGDVVPALPAGAVPAVRKGERLFLRAQVGAIAVERPVTALQPGHPGKRIFVLTAEGQVVPAKIGEGLP